MESMEIKSALVMFLNQVIAMREAQKYYFSNRSKQSFYTSINMEHMVDDSIPRLYAYIANLENTSGRGEMNQTPPDLSGQKNESQPTDVTTGNHDPEKTSQPEAKNPKKGGLPF